MGIARDYFIGQASTLDSQYRGSAVSGQPSDTGFNREDVLKKWLIRHLPKRVSPELGGRIIDSYNNVSGQVDIVIYDDVTPRFGAFPKQYFFAEGVVTAIQVKSNLTSSELKLAVDNLATVKSCERKYGRGMFFGEVGKKIPTGIFAFDTNYKSSESIITALKKLEKATQPPVDFICINKKTYIAYNYGKWTKSNGEKLPVGYIGIDHREGSIWRMVVAIAQEAKKVVSATVDYQKYFFDTSERTR